MIQKLVCNRTTSILLTRPQPLLRRAFIMTTPQATETPPWHTAFPAPKAEFASYENTEVMKMLKETIAEDHISRRKYMLIDVRRNDWEGGTITTSINLPAQSFYQSRQIVYQLCNQAGIDLLLFYCGSSGGRGTRCAGWMQDYIDESGNKAMKAAIVKGGIKGWQKTFGGELMDGYDQKFWADKAQ